MNRSIASPKTGYRSRRPIALAIIFAVGLLFGVGTFQIAFGNPIITASKAVPEK